MCLRNTFLKLLTSLWVESTENKELSLPDFTRNWQSLITPQKIKKKSIQIEFFAVVKCFILNTLCDFSSLKFFRTWETEKNEFFITLLELLKLNFY